MDNIGEGWSSKEAIEGKLAKKDGDIEEGDVDGEDGFFGKKTVKIEDCGDGEGDNKEADEFGEEIVGF